MISAFLAVFSIVVCVIAISGLFALKNQLNNIKPIVEKYNILKEDHDELKIAYDNLSDKYYSIMEENTELERKIDEYEEKLLSDKINDELKNETEF